MLMMVQHPSIDFSGPVSRTMYTSDEGHLSESTRPHHRQQRLQGHNFPIFPRDTRRTQKSECGATKATIRASGTQKGPQSDS